MHCCVQLEFPLVAQGEPHPLKPCLLGLGVSTCSSQRGNDSASGKWEGQSERGLCAQLLPLSSRSLPFPIGLQHAEFSSPGGLQGPEDPAAHRKPNVCCSQSSSSLLQEARRHRNQRCRSLPHCPEKSSLGSFVSSMKAGGTDWKLQTPVQENVSQSDSGRKGSRAVHTEVNP